MKKKIILAGGTGLLGSSLSDYLINKGFEIVVLSRQMPSETSSTNQIVWDGTTEGNWASELEGALAVINFTGKSINCIHSKQNKKEIWNSRVHSVRVLNQALLKLNSPPPCFIQCGAIGYYGNTDQQCNEDTQPGTGFLADLAKIWEEEFFNTSLPSTRKVLIRIGLPLSTKGGLLPPLLNLTSWYLGGSAGNGNQYLSWIHEHDLNRIFEWSLTNNSAQGIYNANAPNPVTNAQFMKTLRKLMNRPWSPPAPSFMVKLGARLFFKTEPSLALSGCYSIPNNLTSQGFEFNFPYLENALDEIINS